VDIDKDKLIEELHEMIDCYHALVYQAWREGRDYGDSYKMGNSYEESMYLLRRSHKGRVKGDLVKKVRAALVAVRMLINNSRGVYGLSDIGDIALWSELDEGGYREDWLLPFRIAERAWRNIDEPSAGKEAGHGELTNRPQRQSIGAKSGA